MKGILKEWDLPYALVCPPQSMANPMRSPESNSNWLYCSQTPNSPAIEVDAIILGGGDRVTWWIDFIHGSHLGAQGDATQFKAKGDTM